MGLATACAAGESCFAICSPASPDAPAWYELLQIYRRQEARGEIRGGRFIAGVGGEQFADSDAVSQLRALRDERPKGELVIVSAADPPNLVGIFTDDVRIPSTAANRVAYFDGTGCDAEVPRNHFPGRSS